MLAPLDSSKNVLLDKYCFTKLRISGKINRRTEASALTFKSEEAAPVNESTTLYMKSVGLHHGQATMSLLNVRLPLGIPIYFA